MYSRSLKTHIQCYYFPLTFCKLHPVLYVKSSHALQTQMWTVMQLHTSAHKTPYRRVICPWQVRLPEQCTVYKFYLPVCTKKIDNFSSQGELFSPTHEQLLHFEKLT